jgi:hypothetical protein
MALMCKRVNDIDLIIGGDLFKLDQREIADSHVRGVQLTEIAHEPCKVIQYKVGIIPSLGPVKSRRFRDCHR